MDKADLKRIAAEAAMERVVGSSAVPIKYFKSLVDGIREMVDENILSAKEAKEAAETAKKAEKLLSTYWNEVERVYALKAGVDGKDGRNGIDGKNGRDGKDGKNPDEHSIVSKVLAGIRQPKDGETPIVDKDGIIEEVVDRIIKEKKLKKEDIFGLTEEIASYRNQLAGKAYGKDTWARGGGDTVSAGTNVTLVRLPNGTVQINATGGGSGGQVNTVVGGTNITVDSTDPVNPIVNLGTGVDAAKIANGSVSNTEFQYLDGVTSNIQTQFTGKQATLTLTTTGSSGAATLIGATLNIPQYASAPGGSNTQVQFNDSGAFGGDSAFTYDKAADTLTVGANTIGGTLYGFNTSGATIGGSFSGTVIGGGYENNNAVGTALSAQQLNAGGKSLYATGGLAEINSNFYFSGTSFRINSLSGILKASTGVVSVATAGTDYQAPITLTTTGTSGVATFSANTLNVPNYTYTLPTASTSVLGGVKVDGTTITISGGVISAATGGTGTVTSVSVVTANGISGSVATATTTPAITLTLGAITPTSIAASGTVTGSNLSGTNTGDQTITLTGDVTGSGTGSFATTIKTDVALAGNPTTTTQTAGNNTTRIATTAFVTAAVAAAGGVTSVSGTTNRITSTGGTTPIIDISASYVGQSSITTLGTIGTGVWNGTVVTGQYGGTGVANTGKTITLGGNLATSGAFDITFTVTGTTNVTLPTTGTLAALNGTNTWTGVNTYSVNGTPVVVNSADSTFRKITFQDAGAATGAIGAGASYAFGVYLANLSTFVGGWDASGNLRPGATATYSLGTAGLKWTTAFVAALNNGGTLTLPTSADTLVGKATTDTFTNKTYDTAGTGNSFSINGLAATANTGTGAVVRATSPDFVTGASIGGVAIPTISSSSVFTAKTIIATSNVVEESTTTTSSATPTPTGGSLRNFFTVTALAAGATFAAPSGTPASGNYLTIRIKDNGTARTLAWNAIYRAVGVTLPTTTVISKTLYVGMRYNLADTVWDVIATAQQA